ncbi:MAG TPA: endonuclease/exonuclease/phosphatase family protein [Bacteriovoracaceae bacterium]|nr:endonuclease/exonuclease/phosphatase family protein [Bacteriovoracaceae bacterium]
MKFLFAVALASTLAYTPSSYSQSGSDGYYIKRVLESDAHTISGTGSLKELNPLSIKTLVWNIKKAELPDWKPEFLQYSKGRDLVLIQEAYTNDLFKNTLAALKDYRFDMGVTFIRKRDSSESGTMIGSLVDPLEVVVKHSLDLEPVVSTPKSMIFAKYPVAGLKEELLVISVHAINITTPWAFKRHINSATDEISKHIGPVLYAGDFNTWSEFRLRHLFASVKTMGLKAVEFKNGDKRMKFSDNYLDHAFTRGLRVITAEVVPESKGSDHKPLHLELALEE